MKRKLSAALLASLIVFSLCAQAFHFIYHAQHSSNGPNANEINLVVYQHSASCTLCDQILHQGYTFLPAQKASITPPAFVVIDEHRFHTDEYLSIFVRSVTNKAPPSLFNFS